MSDAHALRRTSPKGPGSKFIGVCTKCGMEGLTVADMGKGGCANIRDVSDGQALLEMIDVEKMT